MLSTASNFEQRKFLDPFQNRALITYLENVRDWHGYIRFLGLPHLRENPDVAINKLYVEPRLSSTYVSTDTVAEDKTRNDTVLNTLREHRRLVILGDPGSGKS